MATVASFQRDAWRKLGLGTRGRPGEIFPQWTKRDYDDLKAQYTAKYGYTVRIPGIDDIIHLVPNALKTDEQIKADKKANLVRLLDSPSPNWYQKYNTVMTFIDDVQDTASIVIPIFHYLFKAAPKAFGKLLPIMGWVLTAYDLLNLATMFGRGNFPIMGAKRAACAFNKWDPFTKKSQWAQRDRIKNWKPNLADFLQAAQVSDQAIGVGISLGPLFGTIFDAIFGAYRYATGQPIRFTFDKPDVSDLSRLSSRALPAVAAISSQGQVFDELTHFWTYITYSGIIMSCSGEFKQLELYDLIEDPMNVMIPAPRTQDPVNLGLFQEMGLDPQGGIGWPYNGATEITVGDLIDAQHEACRTSFRDFCFRHQKDWYGWTAAVAMNQATDTIINAMDPSGEYFVDDTKEAKVFWRMIKAPLLPRDFMTETQAKDFWDWVLNWNDITNEGPGIMEIQNKLDNMGVPYITAYPATPSPDFEKFWPAGYIGEESF